MKGPLSSQDFNRVAVVVSLRVVFPFADLFAKAVNASMTFLSALKLDDDGPIGSGELVEPAFAQQSGSLVFPERGDFTLPWHFQNLEASGMIPQRIGHAGHRVPVNGFPGLASDVGPASGKLDLCRFDLFTLRSARVVFAGPDVELLVKPGRLESADVKRGSNIHFI